MKIIFAGTTDFGIPTLDKLKEQYEITLIITQPDKPSGRNQELKESPIKQWAEKNNIPVLQPKKISEISKQITETRPDLMLVAAYGQIIPKDILGIPKFGSINIHASLLPKYRGPSPIQTALLNDEKTTGISLFLMDEQVDHGPVLGQVTMTINDDDLSADLSSEARRAKEEASAKADDYLTLSKKLSAIAPELVTKILPKWFAGEIKAQEQDHTKPTHTKLFTREDARINWTDKANNIHQKIKALNPEPGTWTTLNGKTVKVLESQVVIDNKIELPGKIHRSNNQMLVKCKDYSLLVKRIQPAGKKPMTGTDFINGLKNLETKIFV